MLNLSAVEGATGRASFLTAPGPKLAKVTKGPLPCSPYLLTLGRNRKLPEGDTVRNVMIDRVANGDAGCFARSRPRDLRIYS